MKSAVAIFLIVFTSHINAQNILVLGVAQDGGFPHIGCQNACLRAHKNPKLAKYITSIAVVDPEHKQWWLFEATPNMDKQLQFFKDLTNSEYPYMPEGIFITHAHIGHYTGLMFLGREAFGTKKMKVYGLPKFIDFLKSNGPWSQLVALNNIEPYILTKDSAVIVNENISVKAFTVPHRDEFSETAGFQINTRKKGILFIPDIDKWEKWDRDIVEIVRSEGIDYAFIDATFFKDGELPNRSIEEVPHPFVEETMELFNNEYRSVKRKIQFIHLNHTNPLLFDKQTKIDVLEQGYGIAEQGRIYH